MDRCLNMNVSPARTAYITVRESSASSALPASSATLLLAHQRTVSLVPALTLTLTISEFCNRHQRLKLHIHSKLRTPLCLLCFIWPTADSPEFDTWQLFTHLQSTDVKYYVVPFILETVFACEKLTYIEGVVMKSACKMREPQVVASGAISLVVQSSIIFSFL